MERLTCCDVLLIMNNICEDKVSAVPAYQPKGGEIFVYKFLESNAEDWRADGYGWINLGSNIFPRKEPVLRKDFFAIRDNNKAEKKRYNIGFQRFCYRLLNSNKYVVVHYLGNSSLYNAKPHANSKGDRKFTRCAPSVISKAKCALRTCKPAHLYRETVAGPTVSGVHEGILNPRDRKMFENIRGKILNERRISRDEIYNITEYAQHMPGFVKKMDLIPLCINVAMMDETINMVNKVLAVSEKVIFAYDTTFNIGCYYVSILVMRHPFFLSEPVIPIGVLIHEKKLFTCHNLFFSVVYDSIPNMNNEKCVIIVDRERALTNSIEKNLPRCQIVQCWNHFKSDVKAKLYDLNASPVDRMVYMNHIDQLMHSEDVETYTCQLENLSSIWSGEFRKYYIKSIGQDFLQYSSRWRLESLDLYSPKSGITNNISESFNHVLKTVVRPKLPADLMLLSFYELAASSLFEIERGCAQIGNYHLKPIFICEAISKSSIDKRSIITDISKFVKILKQALNNKVKTLEQTSVKSDQGSEKDIDIDHTYHIQSTIDNNAISNASSKVLAELAVAENRVFYIEQTRCYVVMNRKNDPYAVRLSPDKCQCPSTTKCYHVIAAQMLAGCYAKPEKRTLNLSLLRKRGRKREEHRSIGKKKQE